MIHDRFTLFQQLVLTACLTAYMTAFLIKCARINHFFNSKSRTSDSLFGCEQNFAFRLQKLENQPKITPTGSVFECK